MGFSLLNMALALLLSPMLVSLAHRTKAFFAGRHGAPWLQPYWDIARLLRKAAVYSSTTTWIFQVSGVLSLAAALGALALLPFGGRPALIAFSGDLLVFGGLLGLWRFAAILAALDTGSSFEGMGASREATFSALAEPALILCLVTLGRETGSLSLSAILPNLSIDLWHQAFPALLLLATALMLVYLAENGRIPFDDPTTHLELTMIHEVMVLDHSGPDLAFILYSSSLKLWLLGALVVELVVPIGRMGAGVGLGLQLVGMAVLAVAMGTIESVMARSQLRRVPKILGSASILAALALLLVR